MGLTKTEKESNTLHGSVINSAQSSGKKIIIGNVTAKNYLKESLSCILCFIIQGKGSPCKRFDPAQYCNKLNDLVCCNIAHI